MTHKSPTEIFQSFKDIKYLQDIAKTKNIDAAGRYKDDLISDLVSYVSSKGMGLLLSTLKVKTMQGMCKDFDWGDKKKVSSSKQMLASKIEEAMGSNPKLFLDGLSSKELGEIIERTMDVAPTDDEKFSEVILGAADSMGMENLLSSFTVEKLKEFCKNCGLVVKTQSQVAIIECIMTLEDFEAPQPKEKKKSEPSKKKPKITKDIAKVDLIQHYLQRELVEWCNENEIANSGTKKELAERIIAFLNGEPLPKPKSKLGKKRKSKKDDTDSTSEKSGDEKKSPNKNKREEKQDPKAGKGKGNKEDDKGEKLKAKGDKVEKGEKGEKADKAEKAEKGEKGEKGEKADKGGEKAEKGGEKVAEKAEKGEKADKAKKDKEDKEDSGSDSSASDPVPAKKKPKVNQ